MTAYYNEIDPYAAQWLRNLIKAGHIAPGDVDERSIVDVRADDIREYTQAHFFAGIGGWSAALRLAGWPDDRSIWTGSCPCQPFSGAGAGKAADDERHLWPAWFSLIAECSPPIVFGEQVEAALGWGWLDAVFADLEGAGYACGATVLPACGVGAPHIRNRLWFVADAERNGAGRGPRADTCAERQTEGARSGHRNEHDAIGAGQDDELADSNGSRCRPGGANEKSDGRDAAWIQPTGLCVAGFWSAAEWTPCEDGKARPVEPGTFPLATGIPNRVGRLRAYGNAIVPQVAAAFIAAATD